MPLTLPNELLSVRGLKAYFYTESGIVRAVDGVSFTLDRGECLCLVGESGSGKSTVALSILRLLDSPPARIVDGEILFNGKNLLTLPEKELLQIRGGRIAMIFQDPQSSLNPVLKIGDQIIEQIIQHKKMKKSEAKKRAIELLNDVGIPEAERRVNEYPHQFSGGMRQRAMIAMALSCGPEIIIADEPTSALDVTVQAQILEIFKELKDKGLSILFITHDLGIVAEIADKVVVMYAGKIMERGVVNEIFDKPLHPYTRGLFECLPTTMKAKKEFPYIPGTIPSMIDPPKGCVFHPRCRYKFEPCDKDIPKEYPVSDTHTVACYLYGGGK
jgi:oligopeptide/dipeptide ABC transporter ATP-binding protein